LEIKKTLGVNQA